MPAKQRFRIAAGALFLAGSLGAIAFAVQRERAAEMRREQYDAALETARQDFEEAKRKEDELLRPLGPRSYTPEERRTMLQALERARLADAGGAAKPPCTCVVGDPLCSCD